MSKHRACSTELNWQGRENNSIPKENSGAELELESWATLVDTN